MAEIDFGKLEGKLAQLQAQIDTASMIADVALIRSFVAETAISYLINGLEIRFRRD